MANHQGTVAVIVTALTDSEEPFLIQALEAILEDNFVSQIILCIEENNNWAIDLILSSGIVDDRLEIIRIPLSFPGAVRNRALTYVRTPWVAYCDADDIWCKGKTILQFNYVNQAGCDFVGCDHYLSNENGEICAFGLARYIPMPSSWLVRTEIMKKYPFDESLPKGSDGEWWIRTHQFVKKIRYPKMLLHYRVRPHSVSSSTNSKNRKEKIVALARIPIIGQLIFILTGLGWLFTRQETYQWLPSWNEQ